MAKAYADCTCATCGRIFTATAIKRNCSEADSWKKWAEEHFDECPDCRKARIDQEHAEESQKSAEEAARLGYPPLKGSPKQVAWANTIRSEFMTRIPKEKLNRQERWLRAYIIATYTDASFWIERRGAHSMILRQAIEECKARAAKKGD